MIHVVNKRTFKKMADGISVFYIGRPSALGNPFPAQEYGREKCIELYEGWINGMIEKTDMNVLIELDTLCRAAMSRDIYLVCWCAPLACHGDVIKKIITERCLEKEDHIG